MSFDDLLGDRKPETRSATISGAGGIVYQIIERLRQPIRIRIECRLIAARELLRVIFVSSPRAESLGNMGGERPQMHHLMDARLT